MWTQRWQKEWFLEPRRLLCQLCYCVASLCLLCFARLFLNQTLITSSWRWRHCASCSRVALVGLLLTTKTPSSFAIWLSVNSVRLRRLFVTRKENRQNCKRWFTLESPFHIAMKINAHTSRRYLPRHDISFLWQGLKLWVQVFRIPDIVTVAWFMNSHVVI